MDFPRAYSKLSLEERSEYYGDPSQASFYHRAMVMGSVVLVSSAEDA